jgi:glutaredoxin
MRPNGPSHELFSIPLADDMNQGTLIITSCSSASLTPRPSERRLFACRSIRPGAKIVQLLEETVPNIVLLVSPSCGACPSAKSLWKQLRVKYSFSYREVDITTDDGRSLADRHSVRAVPATIIDGRLTFVGVPSRESAEKALLLKMKPRE